MLNDLHRALRLIPNARRWQWAGLIPLALTAAALEGLGAGAVLLLGTVIADAAQATSVPFVSRVAPALGSLAPAPLILVVSAAVGVFYIARGLLLTLFVWVQESVVHSTASEVAGRLFKAYLLAPYVFHLRRNSATLIQTAGHSVETVFALGLNSAVNIATEALTLAGLVLVLTLAAPLATLAAIATIGVMLLLPLLVTRQRARRYGVEAKRLDETLLQDLQQGLSSFKEVRVMGAERHFLTAFAAHRGRLARIRIRQRSLLTGVRVLVETMFVMVILLAVAVLTARGVGGGSLIGLTALYAYAGFRIVPSANRLSFNFTLLQGARPHVDGLCGDLERLERSPAPEDDRSRTAALDFADCVELESVSYAYEQDRGAALHEVSLTIRRGESVGIMGETGAGKSTLVDVLLGLLEPQSGRLLVDGRDARDRIRNWQRRIGYVPQAFALLDDTLRRNVAFGHADAEIDDARVEAALTLAQFGETKAALPLGLDTRLGERGTRLSGGEQQRVAIARALYRDPDVLVFDEATSALDHQTEQAIIHAIEALRGVKTLVVVAHRLSTVRGCDRLVFLQGGRVTAEGPYEALVERSPAFRGMVSAAGTP